MGDKSAVQEIRLLVAEIVENAGSGHPGGAMGMANIMHILYSKILNISVSDSKWINRDIFILSNGHCCAILYVCMYLKGFLTINDLMHLRKIHSNTPGHPEFSRSIEATTGPLGQGVAQAVGYAVALKSMTKYNKPTYKKIFTNRVYCMVGDGCLQEGIAQEALSLAGSMKLNNLTVVYDYNKITIDGKLSISNTEDPAKKMRAMGYAVVEVEDSEDSEKIEELLRRKMDRPVFMIVHTVIGYDTSNKNTNLVHGSVLGQEEIDRLKRQYGIRESAKFEEYISESTREIYRKRNKEVETIYAKWKASFDSVYKTSHPEEYAEIGRSALERENTIEERVEEYMRKIEGSEKDRESTRKISGEFLNYLSETDRSIIGGSADLGGSTCTHPSGEHSKAFSSGSWDGNYINYGIREHAMAGVMNGIAAYGHHRAYGGTFLNFLTYAFPAIRIAAISSFPVTVIGTHDSIFLGGDGPTHQPIETIALLRATPNLVTFRPANTVETVSSLTYSLYKSTGPCAIILSRQKVDKVPDKGVREVLKGAYVVSDYSRDTTRKTSIKKDPLKIVLMATGSEVGLALACKEILKEYSIRVVSFISFELFEKQPEEYKKEITAESTISISIEALSTFGWAKYSKYQIGIDRFGESGSEEEIRKYFKFTPEDISDRIRRIVDNK